MKIALKKLNKKIIDCHKCSRLVSFRKKTNQDKRKQDEHEIYWGKPITGFGDENAEIVLIGLAPAAHGGTRTGRVFTGDKSSDFLFKCLYKAKLSNQAFSIRKDDNLKLKNAYITTSLKCVPPQDKPTSLEVTNCSNYLKEELLILKNSKVIIALGKIAFDSYIKFYKNNYDNFKESIKFKHGLVFTLPNGTKVVGCYHPSPRNVNTKRLNEDMMINLFIRVQKLV